MLIFKKRLSFILVFLMLALQLTLPMGSIAAASDNSIEKRLDNMIMTESNATVGDWTLYSLSNTKVTASAGEAGVTAEITKNGESEDDIQLIRTAACSLVSGEYQLTIPIDSSLTRKARIALEKADETIEVIADSEVPLQSGANSFTVPFSLKKDTSVKLSIRLGSFTADGELLKHVITVGAAAFERTGDYIDPNAPPVDPNRFNNKVVNGDFSNGTDGWWGIANVDGVGMINANGGTANPWDVMCGCWKTFQLQKGRIYSISFDVASEIAQDVKLQLVNADAGDAQLGMFTASVPAGTTMLTYTFNDFEVTEDCNAKLAYQLGGYGTAGSAYQISIDNVVVKEVPRMINVSFNGDFAAGTDGWWGLDSVNSDGAAVKSVAGGSINPWDVMAGYWKGFPLEKGRPYTVSFDLASDVAQQVKFQIVNADAGDAELGMFTANVPAGTEMEAYTFTDFEVPENCNAKIALQMGGYGTAGVSYDIKLDNIKVAYPDLAVPVVVEDPTGNMLKNPDFSLGIRNWSCASMNQGTGSFSVVDEVGVIHIANTGSQNYSVQFTQANIKLYKGNKYKLTFKYKGSEARAGEIRIQHQGGSYEGYLETTVLNFTTDWQNFEKEFTMTYDDDPAATLAFNLGIAGTPTEVSQDLSLDDFNLVMTEGTLPGEVTAKINPIRLNQVGYRLNDAKVAFVVSPERTFKLYTSDNRLIMTGNLPLYTVDAQGGALIDPMSGDIVRTADFSKLKLNGSYYLKVRADKSPVFAVGNKVYDNLTAAVLKLFYYQRCGTPGLSAAYVGTTFAHDPCHITMAKYYDPTDPVYGTVEMDVAGGWHDAGDYGRYVTPASKAVADLLLTAEHFPAVKDLDFAGPDKILAEARYELDWMLKMQNQVNGAVYHKVTTQYHANFSTKPNEDTAQLYLSPISAQAAGDFAAVMAYANRMYNKLDPLFAKKCLTAAEKAWAWLEANPTVNVYNDPSFFGTGQYGDSNASDERFWAATELYKTTRAAKYLDYITVNTLPSAGFGWADMGSYSLVSYLTADFVDTASPMYTAMKDRFIADANKIVAIWQKDGYKVGLDDYVWGSNKDLCDRVMIMIIANRLAPNPNYDAAVVDQLDYLLGRNTNDISYVTGFGEKAAKKPHHRQSAAAGQAVPGMLVGGPNGDIMSVGGDPVSQMVDENTPPAKCYADLEPSYATNEITIYWNSPLVYILGYLYKK